MSTQAMTGGQAATNLTNDVRSAKSAIERGDWVDAGLSITNVAMDIINVAGDPLSAAGSAGFGWIIQHISFLRKPFDALLGDANSIMSSAQGWVKTGDQLVQTADKYRTAAKKETCNWHGSAADGYRKASETQAQGLDALAEVSKGVGQAISGAGKLLAEVRNTVLEFINKCVQKVIQIIIQALAEAWLSFGASIAKGIAQSVMEAVQTAQKIVGKIQKFVSSLQKIMQTVQKIVNLAKTVKQLLETIGGKAAAKPAARPNSGPAVNTAAVDAAANRNYTSPTAARQDLAPTDSLNYRYDQYQGGANPQSPTYAQTSGPNYGGYQPIAGGGPRQSMPISTGGGGQVSRVELPPGVPSWGPSGPPPTEGAPASRVDRARWIGSAVEILVEHGVDPAKINPERIAQIVDRTSDGNPHAVDLRDPNAANGFPPKGLTQITDPVFQAHQIPGYPDIWAPVDNMMAGIMYFLAQWGSLMDAMAQTPPRFTVQ